MRPARPWRLEPTLLFLWFLLTAFGLSGTFLQLLARALGTESTTPPAWLLASGTGLMHLVALASLGFLLRSHETTWRDAFGFFGPRWPRHCLAGLALTVPALAGAWALLQGSNWVLDRLAIPHDPQTAVEAVRGASRFWERGLLFLFASVTAPLTEELLFRGVFWPLLRDRGLRVIGCLSVSFLFACIHLNMAALLPLWLLGIFWTWLYEWTGDLAAPILSHAFFNAANFVGILLLGPEAVP